MFEIPIDKFSHTPLIKLFIELSLFLYNSKTSGVSMCFPNKSVACLDILGPLHCPSSPP